MPSPIIASALADSPQFTLLDTIADERFNAIDFSKMMIDMYEVVDEALLDELAAELDMLGYNGWILADTVQKKRDLLKQAIPIKKTMGTPFAIRQAAIALGVKGEINIQEGFQYQYNGQFNHNGEIDYGANGWANFAVFFDDNLNSDMTEDKLEMFRKMILNFKPVRSILVGVYTY